MRSVVKSSRKRMDASVVRTIRGAHGHATACFAMRQWVWMALGEQVRAPQSWQLNMEDTGTILAPRVVDHRTTRRSFGSSCGAASSLHLFLSAFLFRLSVLLAFFSAFLALLSTFLAFFSAFLRAFSSSEIEAVGFCAAWCFERECAINIHAAGNRAGH